MAAILLDHNVSPRLGQLLRARGHAVMTVSDAHIENATDPELLILAGRLGLVFVTSDDDFIGLHARRMGIHGGILHLPQTPLAPRDRATILAHIVDQFLGSMWAIADRLYRLTDTGVWERWDEEIGWTVVAGL